MLSYLPPFAAGILTLPVTFEVLGRGSVFFALLTVILVAAAGAGLGWKFGGLRPVGLGVAFVLGVLGAEAVSFAIWVGQHGAGEDLTVAFTIAAVRALLLAGLGFASAWATGGFLVRRG